MDTKPDSKENRSYSPNSPEEEDTRQSGGELDIEFDSDFDNESIDLDVL